MGLHKGCIKWAVHMSLTLAMQLPSERRRHAPGSRALMRPMLHLHGENGWGAYGTSLPKVSCCEKLAESRAAGGNNSAISLLRGAQKYIVKNAFLWQDPLMEVRKAFGAKVRRTVLLLNARPSYAQRASKYAAMLPMAGMDPSETNRWLPATVWFRTSQCLGLQ